MPVNTSHPKYDESLLAWSRARAVLAGEDAVKADGIKYLPRLGAQSEQEYATYKSRAAFFNATARTAEGYLGLIFRRPPFIKVPEPPTGKALSGLDKTFSQFRADVDLLGTTLNAYAKNVVNEVIAVGRAGTLLDWADGSENRAYCSLYKAEQILNWKVDRINGRTVPSLIVLYEGSAVVSEDASTNVPASTEAQVDQSDPFEPRHRDQIRVLKLVRGENARPNTPLPYHYVVEIWVQAEKQPAESSGREKKEWELLETRVPVRLGQPLPAIPFIFHGPRHSLPDVEKLPLADIIAVNLDHYRLDADYKHGMHYTAMPTAWVSGFEKGSVLKVGASTAWVTETPGANAGYLEFTGQGLSTFERAMDRDERLMAILGSRLLEGQKKVGEAAQAIELRQSGENSILSSLANSVSQSLTRLLQWVYWWNSTEERPDLVDDSKVLVELNTDFSIKGMDPQEIQAVVAAWQAGALSRETMTDIFRRGEVLPEGRSVEEEMAAIHPMDALSASAPQALANNRPPNKDYQSRSLS